MKRKPPQDPETPEQWIVAMQAAYIWRAIVDCKMYGLLQGGPPIDVERCDQILEAGRRLGHVAPKPTSDEIAEFIALYNSDLQETQENKP